MPLYTFICEKCDAERDVVTSYDTLKGLELLCVHCGGVMQSSAVQVFSVVISADRAAKESTVDNKTKSCGHSHACQCAVKLKGPNPFQKQIDEANNKHSQKPS